MTKAELATAGNLLSRARARFNGAAAAAAWPSPTEGEFDNNFDGVVTGIFHVVDAFELMTTGLRREVRDAEQALSIRSVVLALELDRIEAVSPASRFANLNTRRSRVPEPL
ncbi:MAG: hypothetical protein ACYDCI_11190 [Candidatus Limnocylindrales bacterium]